MWCRRINSLVLSGALFAVTPPALAQQLPPQPPAFGPEQAAWARAQENWLTECTWNQSRGNRDRADAREFCEAYLANHLGPGSPYLAPMMFVPMPATARSGYGQPLVGGSSNMPEGGGGSTIYLQRPPMPRTGATRLDPARCLPPPRR